MLQPGHINRLLTYESKTEERDLLHSVLGVLLSAAASQHSTLGFCFFPSRFPWRTCTRLLTTDTGLAELEHNSGMLSLRLQAEIHDRFRCALPLSVVHA